MPRRREVPKREVLPDSRYNSELVAKFVNVIMRDGKKSVAEGILYDAFDLMEERTKEAPLEIFEKAINNIKPVIEVKSRRVGGSTYQIPMEVRANRRTALAMKWVMTYSRSRSEKKMSAKLAGELLDAYNNRGASIKKKEDTHRMAEANKAFAHYRW
ncbi:SSU ribosomal protein S7P [Desulfatibacillum alkenivorans DSM 16219]|jgi:small subunit ribosomal protein S7|uniref:Small ribosomal subunit protein uS7 n=1 Tax=Desulfatibacillum alkenivorans DSM 16219 TaxID=1121393 RepID=A0A1M7AIE4_9BACT|nr:30S ribosomal protein S7 [Desulfatibacillum alkenivorans]SHL42504.1 SSU ribosomal protein S7P [Desulfatibacillum alkenivorans DSM 16219]